MNSNMSREAGSASGGKKILILYTSIGQGHKSIALNVGYYLQQAGFEVILHDAHEVEAGNTARRGTALYQFLINKLPFIWGWLYDSKWFISASLPYRLKVASKNYHKTYHKINELGPDMVISTQVTASGIMAYLKQQGLYKGKFGITFSDFHLHRYWMYEPYADFYLANIEEQKQEMIALGIRPEKIFVCGMTLKPKPTVDTAAVKRKFNILPDQKVILIASGSLGTGINESLITSILRPQIKVIVVCGKNKQAFEALNDKFFGTDAVILSFYSNMEELYAVSDIFITKAGGLSVSEALRWRLPILISHLLPGMEAHNYDYLLEKGLVMPESINLVSQALDELETGAFKQSLLYNPTVENLFNKTKVLAEAAQSQFQS